jgi:AcrR family transcriptional regulator
MTASSLREQHATVTRERILSAVADLLERGHSEELTVPEVATASGISLRTIYRYFPTREELLEASGRWIGEELIASPYAESLDEIADIYQEACRRFDERPGLVRAMVLSQAGRRVREFRRRRRLEAIRKALRAEVGGLPENELRRAEAALSYLDNMLAYTTMREENGLSSEEVGETVAWAMRTLVEDLRRRHSTPRRNR